MGRFLRYALVAGWLMVAVGTTGCFTMAKQAISEVRGAQGKILLISEEGRESLADCGSVEFTPAVTSVGGRICPPGLLMAYDRQARKFQADSKAQLSGGSTALTIDSDVIFFQGKGLLSGALMLTRVKMRDQDRVLVDALVQVESSSFREGGEMDLAEATVKEIREYLKKQGEKPRRSREK